MTKFLQILIISDKERDLIEKIIHGQVNSSASKELWKCRITVSVCQDVYTEVRNIAKKRKRPSSKTTPLVAQVINRDKGLSKLRAISWGIENEEKDFKKSCAKEACKHTHKKLQLCGLYIYTKQGLSLLHQQITYIRNIMVKVCVVEIKCSHVVRNKIFCESFNKCFFLTKTNDKITLKKTHKYYIQVIAQMILRLYQRLLCCMDSPKTF